MNCPFKGLLHSCWEIAVASLKLTFLCTCLILKLSVKPTPAIMSESRYLLVVSIQLFPTPSEAPGTPLGGVFRPATDPHLPDDWQVRGEGVRVLFFVFFNLRRCSFLSPSCLPEDSAPFYLSHTVVFHYLIRLVD